MRTVDKYGDGTEHKESVDKNGKVTWCGPFSFGTVVQAMCQQAVRLGL
jgi:hypothetical protein